ncbi:MAG: hypothetical protein KH264_02385 [Actinomyces graevenitzii]|jgi:hypothetical protein|uniref:Uncharacterized protein n=3 Tax=Actinomyces graevenitzii TaxID=55565 RepID=G9PG61_9ACTO|nr:hypothetical protein [Actinomyces graevenitzii]EHM88072.1 hypothetical protein HMPREF0045_01183 [Actinomyces graevenitzii C83]ERH18523.1 hypothetical protein HMPREF1978_00340 [Actinomyces graevenitzii F0530]MBF0933237.1 CsbD family protein [Actinomyces graevenitzii]MBF0971346.1 CsbD family protein [Actinomyces graevenitzii]MBS4942061.1 hypothetical protein [Actinomyces graevenitzii]
MGIADFAKQAEELADKAKEAAKNVDADQVAETAHDLADKAKGTAGGKFDSAIETAEGLTDKAADALKNLK